MAEPNDEEKRNYAKSVMDETTAGLSKIGKIVSDRTLEALKELRSWQRTLITLDFAVLGAMAPIFYAIGKLPSHRITFLAGIVLLIFDGVYLLNKQLRTIEQDLRELPVSMSGITALMRSRLDAARDAYLEPTDDNLLKIVTAGKKVITHSGDTLQKIAEEERPTFTNDIGIGAFVLAIVLLMRGFIYSKLVFWLIFAMLLSYFIVRALRDVGEVKKNKGTKLNDVKVLMRFNVKKPRETIKDK